VYKRQALACALSGLDKRKVIRYFVITVI